MDERVFFNIDTGCFSFGWPVDDEGANMREGDEEHGSSMIVWLPYKEGEGVVS